MGASSGASEPRSAEHEVPTGRGTEFPADHKVGSAEAAGPQQVVDAGATPESRCSTDADPARSEGADDDASPAAESGGQDKAADELSIAGAETVPARSEGVDDDASPAAAERLDKAADKMSTAKTDTPAPAVRGHHDASPTTGSRSARKDRAPDFELGHGEAGSVQQRGRTGRSGRPAEMGSDESAGTPRWLTIGAAAAAGVAVVMVTIGLANSLPSGDIDAFDKANKSTGALYLKFLRAPPGFVAQTTVSFYDSTYSRAYGQSDPILDATLAHPSSRSNLLKVYVQSRIVAPGVEGKGPGPVTWLMDTVGSGQMQNVANVHDNGKLLKGACPTGYIDSRVPDNAVRLDPEGPDPSRLSFGYFNSHPPTFDANGLANGQSVPMPDFGAGATEADVSNSLVKGDTTVYAGVVCPSVATDSVDSSPSSDCKMSDAAVTATLPSDPVDSAEARALGVNSPVTSIYVCPPTITEIHAGVTGQLNVGSILTSPLMINSASGDFAAHLPKVAVLAVDASGKASVLPVTIQAYPKDLLGLSNLPGGQAPSSPTVPASQAPYLTHVKPETISLHCPGDPECDQGGRVLQWEQSTTPSDIEFSGTNRPIADAYRHNKDVGTAEYTIGLAFFVPLLGVLIQRGRRRRVKRRASSKSTSP